MALKGKNIAMDEQDKNNFDPAVAETTDTDPAPPAEVTVEKETEADASSEVTVEKETEAAPPSTEVAEVTFGKETEAAKGIWVRVRVKLVRVRVKLVRVTVEFGLTLGLGLRSGQGWGTNDNIFHLIMYISYVVATILYPPLKGKNIAMDEQDKSNTDPTVAETVDTDPAPPAEVTLEKEKEAAAPAEVTVEKEAAPPPTEVTEVTEEKEAEAANGMRVRV